MQVTFNEQDVANPETRRMLLALLGGEEMVLCEPPIIRNFEFRVEADTKQAVSELDKVADAAAQCVRVLNDAAEAGQAVLAAPAPPAPSAAPAAPAATAGSDMFDTEGYPWDARIHSETRNKNADGSWRVRRGVDKDLLAAVRLEFKNGAANAQELAEDAAPTPTPAAPAFGGDLPQGAAPLEPAAPAAPPPVAPVAPISSTTDATAWPTAILGEPSADKGAVQLFMEYAMNLIQDGRIQSAKVLEIAQGEGLKTLVGVGTFPEKIPVLVAKIQTAIGA